MARSSTPSYALTLKLNTEMFQEHILDKRFRVARSIYNSTLNYALKRFDLMCNNTDYLELRGKSNRNSQDNKKMSSVLKLYNLTDYDIQMYASGSPQKHFRNNIDTMTAQKIGARVYRAFRDTLLFREHRKIHFKSYENGLDSLEGKTNKTGIRFKDNKLEWLTLKIPIKENLTEYERIALRDRVKYCRVKRIWVRGKYKYYLQLILEGKIPKTKETVKERGTVGIDIGVSTVAVSSNKEVKLIELSPNTQNIEDEKRRVQRYLDRSRRAMNAQNYNDDGTIKRGKKLNWIKSKNYKKAQYELKEIQRKQADIRKYNHHILSKYIVSLGDNIKVEQMSFKGLQARAKKTTADSKGRIRSKKRFGKTLANRAPAMLISMIKYKANQEDKIFQEVNTWEVKASQFNHHTGVYKKKKLSQRVDNIDGNVVQRDMYSAFLIQHVRDNLCSISREDCIRDFEMFLVLHNMEMIRLKSKD